MSWFTTNHIIILVLAALGVLLFFIYLRNLAKVRASESWPAVQGTIMESWVDERTTTEEDGSISRRYSPKIHYRYTIQANAYHGDRIAFGPGRSGNRSSAEKVIARFPKGSTVMVYYDPEKPADAVLDRSISKSLLVAGAVFFALAAFFYIRWG